MAFPMRDLEIGGREEVWAPLVDMFWLYAHGNQNIQRNILIAALPRDYNLRSKQIIILMSVLSKKSRISFANC